MSQVRTSYEQELVRAARAVARLESARTALKRRLVEVNGKLRMERKVLKGLASVSRQPNIAPSRLTGGATGHVLPPREQATTESTPAPDQATDLFMEAFEVGPEWVPPAAVPLNEAPKRRRKKRRKAK